MRLIPTLCLIAFLFAGCGFGDSGGDNLDVGQIPNPPSFGPCDLDTLELLATIDPNATFTAHSDGTIDLLAPFLAAGNGSTGVQAQAMLAFTVRCEDLEFPQPGGRYCFRLVVNLVDPVGNPFLKLGPLVADLKFVDVNVTPGAVISGSAFGAPAVQPAIGVVSDNPVGGEKILDLSVAMHEHVLPACEGLAPDDLVTFVIALRFFTLADGDAIDDVVGVYGVGAPAQLIARVERMEEGDF